MREGRSVQVLTSQKWGEGEGGGNQSSDTCQLWPALQTDCSTAARPCRVGDTDHGLSGDLLRAKAARLVNSRTHTTIILSIFNLYVNTLLMMLKGPKLG